MREKPKKKKYLGMQPKREPKGIAMKGSNEKNCTFSCRVTINERLHEAVAYYANSKDSRVALSLEF